MKTLASFVCPAALPHHLPILCPFSGISGKLELYVELNPYIAKGGLEFEGTVLGIQLKPVAILDIKKGTVGGRFDLGLELISIGESPAAAPRMHSPRRASLFPASPHRSF